MTKRATIRRWYATDSSARCLKAGGARGFSASDGRRARRFRSCWSCSGLVPVKMLPFDNKNELQLVIDMPEGTPLESTDAVIRDFDGLLSRVSEVT